MSDRHPKWVQVPPGRTIEPGQSYRIEYRFGDNGQTAKEAVNDGDDQCYVYLTSGAELFIDSTWSPPLELPTEPTWGIAVTPKPKGMNLRYDEPIADVGRYALYEPDILTRTNRDYQCHFDTIEVNFLLDFIPLTPEQVARIESNR